ncbi:MAG: indole-3-glycerol phosphate synthase TrpC [Candidatus Zixiibacteriota bacterium]
MLAEIVAHKRKLLAESPRRMTTAEMLKRIEGLPPVIGLKSSISSELSVSIIAEIKRRSPSKGQLARQVDVAATARTYEAAGARGISVLTDERYFAGSPDDLKQARTATRLPIVRKDFIVDEYQVYESRLIGADVILLIVAALEIDALRRLHAVAQGLGMEVLVEIHNEKELRSAVDSGVELIGINNRNLTTFDVSLETTERLCPLIPDGVVCIAESGIHTREDMQRMEAAGVDAVLVGESLMVADDPAEKIRQLLGKRA